MALAATTKRPFVKYPSSEVIKRPTTLESQNAKKKYDFSSEEEIFYKKEAITESPYDKHSSREMTRRPIKHTTTLNTRKTKKKYDYSSTRKPNLYSSVLFHTRKPPILDDPYDKFWSRKKSRKKDTYLKYETTEYPDIVQDTTTYPEIILDDPKDKNLFTKDRPPPPPLPPAPPSPPAFLLKPFKTPKIEEISEEFGKKIKIKRKRPNRKQKKARIRKKELKKRLARKRSLAFQYKVLDLVNHLAYWTSFLSIFAFALAI